MLGWEFMVMRATTPDATYETPELLLARWRASLGGTKWIDDLVTAGLALQLQYGGYPNQYAVSAGVFAAALAAGVPTHNGRLVIGDDYVHPPGWTGNVELKAEELRSLEPGTMLLVNALDQS